VSGSQVRLTRQAAAGGKGAGQDVVAQEEIDPASLEGFDGGDHAL
jgi:hypothetical protein